LILVIAASAAGLQCMSRILVLDARLANKKADFS
jgi:hypothetical protein